MVGMTGRDAGVTKLPGPVSERMSERHGSNA
jgi:hypothetical protein